MNKYIEYIKVNFYLIYRKLIEYKFNFWTAIYSELGYLIMYILFFYVIFGVFGNVIEWQLKDYFLFLMLITIIEVFQGLFLWKGGFSSAILSGRLNTYLARPINPFIGYFIEYLAPPAFIMLILDTGILILGLLYFKIILNNLFFGILIFLIIALSSILLETFIGNLNFFLIGIDRQIGQIVQPISDIIGEYPAPFYYRMKYLKYFFFIFPYFFVGSLLVPLLANYSIWNLKLQLILLLGLFILLLIGNILTWKYGLKNYEAFG